MVFAVVVEVEVELTAVTVFVPAEVVPVEREEVTVLCVVGVLGTLGVVFLPDVIISHSESASDCTFCFCSLYTVSTVSRETRYLLFMFNTSSLGLRLFL